jgi:hypothetical protein
VAVTSTCNNQSYFHVSGIEVIFSFSKKKKNPTMLRKMFSDPVSIVWIYFLESQMKVSSTSMKKIQSDSISDSKVAVELNILSNKMKSRRDENFLATKRTTIITR